MPQIQSTTQPLEKVTTPNLEALRALARGAQLQREGDLEQSVRLFKYATELDPDFATAYARMGSVLFAAELYPEARAALEKAHADVETQQANVAAARAALADAQLSLGYTRVLSPIDGIAGLRRANIGDFVGPTDSTPLTNVSKVDPIYAEFPISEQRALAVFRRWSANPNAPRGVALELLLADGSVHSQPGRADVLDRQVDASTGTVLARGTFPNPGNVLRPGQYAKVRAVVEVKKNALLIPQRAVQDVQGVHQIAAVKADDTVDVRPVEVGARVGPLWIVSNGVKAGERIIVEGGDRVRPGQKVRPEASADAAPAAPR